MTCGLWMNGNPMKVDIFVTRLVTSAHQVEASSLYEAIKQFNHDAMEPTDTGTIINAVFRAHGHEAQLVTYPHIGDRYRKTFCFFGVIPVCDAASKFRESKVRRVAPWMIPMINPALSSLRVSMRRKRRASLSSSAVRRTMHSLESLTNTFAGPSPWHGGGTWQQIWRLGGS
jgi:hypothetical protein